MKPRRGNGGFRRQSRGLRARQAPRPGRAGLGIGHELAAVDVAKRTQRRRVAVAPAPDAGSVCGRTAPGPRRPASSGRRRRRCPCRRAPGARQAAVARARQRGVRAAPAVGEDRGAAAAASPPPRSPSSCSSSANSVSERMSIRQPVSRAASRAFWPSRPIASESWSSGTMTVAWLASSSTSTSRTRAGLSALATKRAGSSL